MTQAERNEKLTSLQAEITTLVSKYNEAIRTKDTKQEDIIAINNETEKKIGEYVATAKEKCFEECKATEDPMLHAVKVLSYPVIRIADKKDNDTGLITRSVSDSAKDINLFELHKYCGGIGKDDKWVYKLEKFNCLLTAKKAKDLGLDPKKVYNSYAMNEISRAIDLGATPTSNTQILKNLQVIVDSMIGDNYKATSHDVSYLTSIYSKKGKKALAVACANHRYLCNYIACICHRIVTGAGYELEHKEKA